MERTMEMSLFIIGGVRGGEGEFEYLWTKIREMQLIFFGFYYEQYMLLNTVLFSVAVIIWTILSFWDLLEKITFFVRTFIETQEIFWKWWFLGSWSSSTVSFSFFFYFFVFVSDKLFSPFHFNFSIFRLFVYIRFV